VHPTLTAFSAGPCPAALTQDDLAHYRTHGFIAFNDVLSADEVAATNAAITRTCEQLLAAGSDGTADYAPTAQNAGNGNYSGARISGGAGLGSIQFEPGIDPYDAGHAGSIPPYRKLFGYERSDPVFEQLTAHPRIQGFISAIFGQEAVLKGTMALSKPARIGSEKPWHQDNAYFDWLPLDLICTAWVAIDDATVANGCMHLVPGAHLGGALKHWHDRDCEIIPGRLDTTDAIPVELRAGGVMFFSGMLPHQTPPNRSEHGRRALQFQFRGVETVQVDRDEYAKAFAEADGTPATCSFGERRQSEG
jgi:phytanoyl-CoA hydroxylase